MCEGLLSLTVEFYRLEPIPCRYGDDGQRISPALGPGNFPYDNAKCGLVCVPDDPHSTMRGGAAKDVHVIPAPDVLNFGTATLLAAACCIPAILSMVSMWNKILEINWKRHWGNDEPEERLDEQIEGTNGATVGKMRHVNGVIRMFLSAIEAPLLVAAVLAILIVGELNFFSTPVYYETEPMASIGRSNSTSDIAPVLVYQSTRYPYEMANQRHFVLRRRPMGSHGGHLSGRIGIPPHPSSRGRQIDPREAVVSCFCIPLQLFSPPWWHAKHTLVAQKQP